MHVAARGDIDEGNKIISEQLRLEETELKVPISSGDKELYLVVSGMSSLTLTVRFE